MTFPKTLTAAMAALTLMAGTVMAGDIAVSDAYMRSSTPTSKTGAAFLILSNETGTDDRLIAARTDIAARVELHTHIADENGVMKMREVEGGIALPAGGSHALRRGGDHIMMMGLTRPLVQGEEIPVTLVFETAGEIEVMIPVDSERKAKHGAMKHGS